jgi:hypothetical protein
MDVVEYSGRAGPKPRSALALTPDAVRAVGQLANMAVNWAKTRPANAAPQFLSNMPNKPVKRQRNKQKGVRRASVPSGLGLNSATVTINGIFTITNSGTTGTATGGWTLGITTIRTDLGPVSYFIPQMTSLAAVFREYTFKKVMIMWEGDQAPNTTSGSIAVSIDDDPGAPKATAYAGCINNKTHFIAPLTGSSSLSWNPSGNGRDLMRFCGTSGNKPEDDLSFGTIKFVSANSLTSTAALGQMAFTFVIGFNGLY